VKDGVVRDGVVTIDIALLSLRVSTSVIGRALALLDDAERATASAREGDARRRHVVAHAASRVVLAERLGVDPARLDIESEPGGRPTVDGIAFSLSHSGDRGAVAITEPGVNVGVDLEQVRVRPHLDRLAERVFEADEYQRWRGLAPRVRPRVFAQRWTEVEAVLKARGTGIAGGLASARDLGPGWSRTPFDAGAGYVGAIAADASPMVVTTRVFRLGDALGGNTGLTGLRDRGETAH
jgi:4'-phosphopantetheinyl transferase